MRTGGPVQTLAGSPGGGLLTGLLGVGYGPTGITSPLRDLLDLVDRHGQDDHRAGDHLLPERRDADDDQAVGQEADHEGADDGAAYGAPTAGQGGAADHHRGDGVQLVELTQVGGGGGDVGDLQDADHPRAQAGQDVDPGLHALDRYAGQLGGALVAAGRVQPAAERRTGEHDREDHREGDHHPGRDRQAERPAGEDRKKPVLSRNSCPRSSLVMFCPSSSTSVRPRAT